MDDSEQKLFYITPKSDWSVFGLVVLIAVMELIDSGRLLYSILKGLLWSYCVYLGYRINVSRPRAKLSDGVFQTLCFFIPGWSVKLSDLDVDQSQYYLSEASPMSKDFIQSHARFKTVQREYVLCGDPEMLESVAGSLGISRSMNPLFEQRDIYWAQLKFFCVAFLQLMLVPAAILFILFIVMFR